MVHEIDGRDWLASLLDAVEHETRRLEQLHEPVFEDVLRAAARLRAEIVAALAGIDAGEGAAREQGVPEYARSTRDSGYWLSQAVGFVVESPAGRVGVECNVPVCVPTNNAWKQTRSREKRIRVGADYDASGNTRRR